MGERHALHGTILLLNNYLEPLDDLILLGYLLPQLLHLIVFVLALNLFCNPVYHRVCGGVFGCMLPHLTLVCVRFSYDGTILIVGTIIF